MPGAGHCPGMRDTDFEAAYVTVRLGAIAENFRTYQRLAGPAAVAGEGGAGLDLGAHGAGRELPLAQVAEGLGDGEAGDLALPAGAEVQGDAVDAGDHQEGVAPGLVGEHERGAVLVDDGLDAVGGAVGGDRDAAAAPGDDEGAAVGEHPDAVALEDLEGPWAGDQAPPAAQSDIDQEHDDAPDQTHP